MHDASITLEGRHVRLEPLEAHHADALIDVALANNQRSRDAILRLGATEEGTLRRHLVAFDGSYRDSVYFSILDDEWPAVKQRLEERLAENGR
jgi:N-acetyltransferase